MNNAYLDSMIRQYQNVPPEHKAKMYLNYQVEYKKMRIKALAAGKLPTEKL